MPRSMSPVLVRSQFACLVLLLACSLTCLMPLHADAARPLLGSISVGSDDYTEQMVNATQGRGDVLGGEQGIKPSGTTELVPVRPQTSHLDSGSATWLSRLASLFAWLSTSRWFSNPE